jgi:hypothetical protein
MLCPERAAKNHDCSMRYRLALIRQHYLDTTTQSWGVISGAAEPARGARAMVAVENYLMRRRDGLVLLFTPPFNHANLYPGYIFVGPSGSGSGKRAYAPLTG